MKVLTTEQAQRLLIQAKHDGYYELFLLEFATGLRIGESATQNRNIFLFQSKNINANVIMEDQTIGGYIDTVCVVARNEVREKLICQ